MIKAPKQTQPESKDSKAFRPKKRTPAKSGAQPMAGILWLQRTVGNRAVQRLVAEAQRGSADTGVIQRHLAPGALESGYDAGESLQTQVNELHGTAPVISNMAAVMSQGSGTLFSLLYASSQYREGLEEGPGETESGGGRGRQRTSAPAHFP
jgi:hypothetical protein